MGKIVGVLVVAMVFWWSAAWAQPGPGPCVPGAPPCGTIKIGLNQPLTGALSTWGMHVRAGAEIARDWINARGGVLGRPIELIVEDNRSEGSAAAAAVERLVVDGNVVAMMGTLSSTLTLAMMAKLQEHGVPAVIETSTATAITRIGNPWIFRIGATAEKEGEGFGSYFGALAIKKADFLATDTDFGNAIVNGYAEALKKHGLSVGTVAFLTRGASDAGPQVSKIKRTNADTIFVWADIRDAVQVLKQVREQRLQRGIVLTGGTFSPEETIAQATRAADGVYQVVYFVPWFPEVAPDPKLVKAFVDEWRKRGFPFGRIADGSRGYDSTTVIAEAVRIAGSVERKAVRDALWKVDITGLSSQIKFEKEGPIGKESGHSTSRVFLVQIKDGRVVLPPFVSKP